MKGEDRRFDGALLSMVENTIKNAENRADFNLDI